MQDFDKIITDFLSRNSREKIESLENIEFGVSTTYMIERLVICHVRMWQLEDKVRLSTDDAERSELKRIIDYVNSKIRPRLIQAIGDSIIKACASKDMTIIAEPSLKKYGEEK